MELQTGGIIVIIIITILVLISYAIYLIYSDNKELKGKVNILNSSLENVQNNFTSFSNAVTNQFQKVESQDEDIESDDEESNDEEDIDEEEEMMLKSFGLNQMDSIDLFNQSSEELEDLKKFQTKVQGTKIKEVEESEDDEDDEDDEEEQNEEQNEEQSKLNITLNNDNAVNCSKKLTRGKNVGKICERKVIPDSEFCSLHQM